MRNCFSLEKVKETHLSNYRLEGVHIMRRENSSYAELNEELRGATEKTAQIAIDYQSLGSPHRAGSLIPKRGILIILLSVVAGGFIAAVVALLMPCRQTTIS